MSDESQFYESVFPEPFRVLGLRLKPFCIGHKILLHRLGSAFVDREATSYTFSDLALAAFVCSFSYEDGCAAISDAGLDDALEDWAGQLTRPTLLHKLRLRKAETIDMQGNAKLFVRYRTDCMKSPFYTYDPNKCSEISAPIDQLLLTSLLATTGMSYSEAMNLPYGLALHIWLTQKAINGSISMSKRSDIEQAQDVGEELARLVAEGRLGAEAKS